MVKLVCEQRLYVIGQFFGRDNGDYLIMALFKIVDIADRNGGMPTLGRILA
jgi:hypothetical protein